MFDVNGRLVRTLVDSAFLERGSHKVSIDGRDRQGNALATGVFFYRVETVEGSASGRIAIVK
jgi:flagellar hook assembly protein FlgD